MLTIHKITSSPVVDFAAEELKKYLRMMMPRAGEVAIDYAPGAKDGFRLGLMADFDLSTEEAENIRLDDILHIDTTEDGGIIAGSNPRSVLLAVYQYLRMNGCRWLFPGIDGEYIPIRQIEPTKFHKMADNRYRGQCNEGAETQQCVLETIDFTPKLGMNCYMLEFDIPYVYYERYYNHNFNPAREKEPVSIDTVLQWKRASEVELSKRGLLFFDMGHGWTAESLGISSVGGWTQDFNNYIPEESRQYLAMINGKRELFNGVALNTNICMSNPAARKMIVDHVVEYARQGTNVDVLKISLADAHSNHCECEECRKQRPSDWHVQLLNEIDAAMTEQGLENHLSFSAYSDGAWEPEHNSIKNPARFIGMLAPITRSYLTSVPKNPVPEKLTPYVRNVSSLLDTLEEYVWRSKKWMERVGSPFMVYEYHFWQEQFFCPSCLDLAKRVYEDVFAYHDNGFIGMMEDCSQRNFFPNALAFEIYAATLFDFGTDYEAAVDDYFAHAYGKAKDIVKKFFEELSVSFPQRYVEISHSMDGARSGGLLEHYHDPSVIPGLQRTLTLCDQLDADLAAYRNSEYRVQTVAVRLLGYYTEYLRALAQAFILKADSRDAEAKAFFDAFLEEFGKKEIEIERYYDQHLAGDSFKRIFTAGTK